MVPLYQRGGPGASATCPDAAVLHVALQVGGVLDCMAIHVVVEVGEDVQTIGQVLDDLAGLRADDLRRGEMLGR